MKIVICLLAIEALLSVNATVEVAYESEMLQFCGRKLRRALELVCNETEKNIIRELQLLRKSIKHIICSICRTDNLGGGSKEIQRRSNFSKQLRRRKRDYDVVIVESCCQKPCSLDQLQNYC